MAAGELNCAGSCVCVNRGRPLPAAVTRHLESLIALGDVLMLTGGQTRWPECFTAPVDVSTTQGRR